MTPVRDYFSCDFCSTFHFPKPLASSDDGVTPLDDDVDADCPVCGIQLSLGAIEGHHVNYCKDCRGVLIDSEMFADVIRRRRARRNGKFETPRPLNPEELERKIDCPICHGRITAMR